MESFPIVPAQTRAVAIWVGFTVAALLGVVVILLMTMRGARNSTFEVSAEGLRLRGDVYGRFIPADKILSDSAQLVDLTTNKDFRPVVRNVGTSVGGYQVGWFRLQNERTALVYLTDRRRVVFVPTTEGYSVLLSAQSPERLVARLRAMRTH